MSTLLKNARIFDGSGRDAFCGDVLIEGERIAKVSDNLSDAADTVIDLGGRSLAPGFIDAHSHNDWFAIKNDPLPYFDPFIRQGITTFVAGNCGLSATGFDKNSGQDSIGGGLFFFHDTAENLCSVAEYLDAVDKNMPCNLAVLAGHCTARASASTCKEGRLPQNEEERMLGLLENALKEGAAGISLGLMYEPGLYADIEELKKVAALCAKYDRPMTVHARACSAVSMAYKELLGRSHLLRALDELKEIAMDTGVRLQYSHAIFVGRNSFKNKGEFLAIIDELRAAGIDAMFDIYNETLGVSVITVVLPAWYQAMTEQERKRPFTRLKLSLLVHASSLLLGFGFKDIQIAYIGPEYGQYEGKSVHEIAKAEKMSDLKAYIMLCEKSNFKGRVNMGPYSTSEIISEFEHHDRCLFMTDAWVEDHGIQNPAIYDCYPKFLRDALLGTGDTLPRTIRRMTGATADRFSLADRGYIREGSFADLVVFDEDALRNGTPDRTCSFGIDRVFINGRQVLSNASLDKNALRTSGRAIRIK